MNYPNVLSMDCAVTSGVWGDSFRDRSKSRRENLAVKSSAGNCTFVDVTEANQLFNQPWLMDAS